MPLTTLKVTTEDCDPSEVGQSCATIPGVRWRDASTPGDLGCVFLDCDDDALEKVERRLDLDGRCVIYDQDPPDDPRDVDPELARQRDENARLREALERTVRALSNALGHQIDYHEADAARDEARAALLNSSKNSD